MVLYCSNFYSGWAFFTNVWPGTNKYTCRKYSFPACSIYIRNDLQKYSKGKVDIPHRE